MMTSEQQELVLKKAKDLVKKGWCTNASALDAIGEPVVPTDPRACRWCLTGAIERALCDINIHSPYNQLMMNEQLEEILCDRYEQDHLSLTEWNDNHLASQEEVVKLIDEGIAAIHESMKEVPRAW